MGSNPAYPTMEREEFRRQLMIAIRDSDTTVDEACAHLRVARPTLLRWVKGEIAPPRLGRQSALDSLP